MEEPVTPAGPVKLPLYVKLSLVAVGLYATLSMLYIGRDIILPLLFAVIIAMTLSPAVNWLTTKRIPRAISIALVLLAAFTFSALLVLFLYSQSVKLGDAWPALNDKFKLLTSQCTQWASGCFGLSERSINAWITKQQAELMQHSNTYVGVTLTAMSTILAGAFLTPVYIVLILFYQQHLTTFVHKVFGRGRKAIVGDVLTQTKGIIKGYLVGLFTEFVIVSVLNAGGLLLLGIDYAILLGVIGGLLNVIPYLGGLIGVALFMLVALLTKAPVYMLYVFLLYGFIQFVDNNYIVPKIVGSQVKLNALVCIVGVLCGAALWGIPGMFLSIPLIAIIKLVFDNVDSLKPLAFLFGSPDSEEDDETGFSFKGLLRKLSTKKQQG
ncbi:MAG TPA: AI-2E family transporter [Chitinophagales bacterium]|nr:AI-2E family transporter [Chitinophagales bacterium]